MRYFIKAAVLAVLFISLSGAAPHLSGDSSPCSHAAAGHPRAHFTDGAAEEGADMVRIPPDVREAVRKCLNWLARRQDKSGVWEEAGNYALPISCMAGLAMASWAGPNAGPHEYTEAIKRLTVYIVSHAEKNGFIFAQNMQWGDNRPAYGHAFSLLFLSQIYGMGTRPQDDANLRKIIHKAIRFTEDRQHAIGCWFQDYRGGHNEIVTVSHIQALRGAQNAGFFVKKTTIEKALRFNESLLRGGTTPSRTASYVAVLLAAGDYHSKILPQSLRNVADASKQDSYYDISNQNFSNFQHLYSSQICYYVGGETWRNYYAKYTAWCLKNLQKGDREDEAFLPPLQNVHAVQPSRVYTTAVGALIMLMPNKYLPIFQTLEQARKD